MAAWIWPALQAVGYTGQAAAHFGTATGAIDRKTASTIGKAGTVALAIGSAGEEITDWAAKNAAKKAKQATSFDQVMPEGWKTGINPEKYKDVFNKMSIDQNSKGFSWNTDLKLGAPIGENSLTNDAWNSGKLWNPAPWGSAQWGL